MQVIALEATSPSNSIPVEGMLCHDVRDPVQRSEVLARKGSFIQAAEVEALLQRGVAELHLAVPAPDDVGEDDAAARLAAAVAGTGVGAGQAHFGQVTLTSQTRGLSRVRADVLDQVNRQSGALVMTGLPDCPVDVGTPLGVVKCAPLFLEAQVLRIVEQLRLSSGAVLEIEAFVPKRVAFVAPDERLRGNAFERAHVSLAHALEWYGSSIFVVRTPAAVESIAAAYRRAVADGAELILAAGAAATDPLDVMFDGLRAAGGGVDQIGIPAEPGTACWFGHLDGCYVLGLASCELFGRPGALDLLLPQLFTGSALDAALVRRLALGGLLVGGPSRIGPYHVAEEA